MRCCGSVGCASGRAFAPSTVSHMVGRYPRCSFRCTHSSLEYSPTVTLSCFKRVISPPREQHSERPTRPRRGAPSACPPPRARAMLVCAWCSAAEAFIYRRGGLVVGVMLLLRDLMRGFKFAQAAAAQAAQELLEAADTLALILPGPNSGRGAGGATNHNITALPAGYRSLGNCGQGDCMFHAVNQALGGSDTRRSVMRLLCCRAARLWNHGTALASCPSISSGK